MGTPLTLRGTNENLYVACGGLRSLAVLLVLALFESWIYRLDASVHRRRVWALMIALCAQASSPCVDDRRTANEPH